MFADFASAYSWLKMQQGTGAPSVVVTVIRNTSTLVERPSERMVVTSDGTAWGLFSGDLGEQLRDDALTCQSDRRSRLLSYAVADMKLTRTAVLRGDLDVFFEVIAIRPRLIVVGAGHIAVPLMRIAGVVGFETIVVDDRAEFATPDRFPDADQVVHGPYRETLAGLRVDSDTYVVLVTRGHVHDAACLAQVLHSPAAYIGMIGSKQRVRTVLDQIKPDPDSIDALDRVYAPIGIDIGAMTPEEIAVAIVAELVKIRRGGTASSLRLNTRSHG